VTSGKYIDAENYCDGRKLYGNANKEPDCEDGSDEIFETCCTGDFPKYDVTVCS
jgi:hypothetical protein